MQRYSPYRPYQRKSYSSAQPRFNPFKRYFKQSFQKYRRQKPSLGTSVKQWKPKGLKKTKVDTIWSTNLRPDKLKVHLKYFYQVNQNGVSATPTVWQFSGNGPYDPDVAGTGNTANNWTMLSAMYNKYMCTFSKCKTLVEAATAGSLVYQFWGVVRTANQVAPSSVQTLNAQPYKRYKQIQCLSGQTSETNCTFTWAMSTPKVLGRKMDPSIDRVSVSADPGEEWIYEIQVISSSAANVNFLAWLEYWVEFSDREAVPET